MSFAVEVLEERQSELVEQHRTVSKQREALLREKALIDMKLEEIQNEILALEDGMQSLTVALETLDPEYNKVG